MSFDRVEFLVFFIVVFSAYHLLGGRWRWQNALLVLASYFFYGWFDWRLTALLLFYGVFNYLVGLRLSRAATAAAGKRLLAAGIIVNLALLCVFKYADFFITNVAAGLKLLGVPASPHTLGLVLPLGISFFTFQSIAYLVDIRRGIVTAEGSLLTFLAFKSFFPQLVAGPIERAGNLLVQFRGPRVLTLEDVHQGGWLFLYGLFLKIVVANTAAQYADLAFTGDNVDGWLLLMGTFAFTVQIYCDFNGYSLIAKGCAQLLGFHLVWNFSFPYWAVSIQDFWRRWHISLSTWLRDYLYIPLGGSRKGPGRTYLNLMLTMILGGLWHGAAWNFVAWGFLHGAALCLHRLWENNARGLRLPDPLAWLLTQCFVMVGWFFFRVGSLRRAWDLVTSLGSWRWQPVYESYLATLALVLLPAMALELWQMRAQDPLAPAKLGLARYSLLSAALILLVFAKFRVTSYAFIYFQF